LRTEHSVSLYTLILEKQEYVQNFADEVAKLPATCAEGSSGTMAFDAFVSQFGTHYITGVHMGGSFKITSTHSFETCTKFTNTQVTATCVLYVFRRHCQSCSWLEARFACR